MKVCPQLLDGLKGQRGATAIIVAAAMVVLIGFAALAIDIGYLYATKNELQNISDAASLAGAGILGAVYADMTFEEQQAYDCSTANEYDDGYGTDLESILASVQDVVGEGKNQAGAENISIDPNDIFINTWEGTPFSTNNYVQPTAVRVIARRGGLNNQVGTFFGRILNIDSVPVSADATAALTGPETVTEGELKLPVGLSENQFPNDCTEEIRFAPTTDSCAGWHNFFDQVNASDMNDKLLGFIIGDPLAGDPCLLEPCGQAWLDAYFDLSKSYDAAYTPETSGGDAYNFQGGTIASLFQGAFLVWEEGDNTVPVIDPETDKQEVDGNPNNPAPIIALFDYFRFRDGDDDDSIWTTTVPVYADEDECINPNTSLDIIGFANIVVTELHSAPSNTFTVVVECDLQVIEGRGGGGNLGNLKGAIPNLVE